MRAVRGAGDDEAQLAELKGQASIPTPARTRCLPLRTSPLPRVRPVLQALTVPCSCAGALGEGPPDQDCIQPRRRRPHRDQVPPAQPSDGTYSCSHPPNHLMGPTAAPTAAPALSCPPPVGVRRPTALTVRLRMAVFADSFAQLQALLVQVNPTRPRRPPAPPARATASCAKHPVPRARFVGCRRMPAMTAVAGATAPAGLAVLHTHADDLAGRRRPGRCHDPT